MLRKIQKIDLNTKITKIAANSLLHGILHVLYSTSPGWIQAKYFGLGSVDCGYLCQQLEMYGFVTRKSIKKTELEDRYIRKEKINRKEREISKALGILPKLQLGQVPVTRKYVHYKITETGKRAYEIVNKKFYELKGIKPDFKYVKVDPPILFSISEQDTTKGFVYIEVPIKVDPKVYKRLQNVLW